MHLYYTLTLIIALFFIPHQATMMEADYQHDTSITPLLKAREPLLAYSLLLTLITNYSFSGNGNLNFFLTKHLQDFTRPFSFKYFFDTRLTINLNSESHSEKYILKILLQEYWFMFIFLDMLTVLALNKKSDADLCTLYFLQKMYFLIEHNLIQNSEESAEQYLLDSSVHFSDTKEQPSRRSWTFLQAIQKLITINKTMLLSTFPTIALYSMQELLKIKKLKQELDTIKCKKSIIQLLYIHEAQTSSIRSFHNLSTHQHILKDILERYYVEETQKKEQIKQQIQEYQEIKLAPYITNSRPFPTTTRVASTADEPTIETPLLVTITQPDNAQKTLPKSEKSNRRSPSPDCNLRCVIS